MPMAEAKKAEGGVYLEVEIKSAVFMVLCLKWLIDIYMAVSIRQFDRKVWSFKKRCQRFVLGVICTLIVCKPMGLDDITWRESTDRLEKKVQNRTLGHLTFTDLREKHGHKKIIIICEIGRN